jgi:pimeloyl-ACP methyl ester carboxylesterase
MEKIINGIKTNYQIFGEGDGLALLILHGWGSNSERWTDVANLLAEKNIKIIVPDLPGFGNSQTLDTPWNMNNYIKWLEGFIQEINLGEFYLAGHSFGGALAVKYAIGHPQAVKKLFLISAASVRTKTTKKSAYKNLAKIVKVFSFLPGYAFFRKAFYKFIIRKSDYPYVEGTMKDTYKNVILEDLSQFTGFIKIPTILIWGDKDKSTPIDDAYFMNKKIKSSKLVIIEGAGHALNKECPDVLAEKIINNV